LKESTKCLGIIGSKIKLSYTFLKQNGSYASRNASRIQRLKLEVASTPGAYPVPVMKDVTLVAGVKDWTGDIKGRTVHEFFAQIDTYAKVSN
jgi:hypothetical protein